MAPLAALQAAASLRLEGFAHQTSDETMTRREAEMPDMNMRHVANENHGWDDSELLGLLLLHGRGGAAQKSTLERTLLRIFLTVDQRNATSLWKRLSVLKKRDVVSARFHDAFEPPVKVVFLSALQTAR